MRELCLELLNPQPVGWWRKNIHFQHIHIHLRKPPMEIGKEHHFKSLYLGFCVRFRGFLRIFHRLTSLTLTRSCLRRPRRVSIATNRIRLKPKSKPANIEHWHYGTKSLVSRCQVRCAALDYLAIGTHHPFQFLF